MKKVLGSREKAITQIERHLRRFERLTQGLAPRVILVPQEIFDKYLVEKSVIDSALPAPEAPRTACFCLCQTQREWTEVRIVTSEKIKKIEVY